jgi:hypothetical protein
MPMGVVKIGPEVKGFVGRPVKKLVSTTGEI